MSLLNIFESRTELSQRVFLKDEWLEMPCDICGSDQFILLGHREYVVSGQTCDFQMNFTDVSCDSCGFVYERQRPSESFLYGFYNDAHDTFDSAVKISVDYDIEARLEPLSKYLFKGAKIFEIGAGGGHFCRTMQDIGYDAKGLDPKRQEKRQGLNQGFISSMEVNEDQPIISKDGMADAIVSYYVMEHVREPAKWLRSISAHLKNDGLMIIEVPNFLSHPYESLHCEHMTHFTPDHLIELLRQNGFEVILDEKFKSSRYYGFVIIAFLRDRTKIVSPEKVSAEFLGFQKLRYRPVKLYKDAIEEKDRLNFIADVVAEKILKMLSNNPDLVIGLWAVNDYSERLALKLKNMASNLYLLDNAVSKIGQYLWGLSNPVQQPDKSWKENSEKIIVLCSPAANAAIAGQVSSDGYKNYTFIDGTIL